MYNRYIRNDNGVYTRIPQEERQQPPQQQPPQQQSPRQTPPPIPPSSQTGSQQRPPPPPPPSPPSGGNSRWSDGLTGFLRHILDQLHLDHVDTGDLILLVLLFFLFRENADEELLVALGLLLIL